MVDNSVFLAGLKKAEDELKALMQTRVTAGTELLKGAIQQEAPSDTGMLRGSVTSRTRTDADAIVGTVAANREYAAYVHEGTGIYAKSGGRKTPWKYFVATGRYKGWHVTKGQKPNAFMVRAVNAKRSDIARILGVR